MVHCQTEYITFKPQNTFSVIELSVHRNAVIVLNFILKMEILLLNCAFMYCTIIIQLGSYEWTFLTKEIVYICFHQTAFNISDMDNII